MKRLVAVCLLCPLVAVASCIDDPTFHFVASASDGGADETSATATPPSSSNDMVLVPAATLAPKLTTVPGEDAHVPAFRLDRHETKVASYATCVAAGKCTAAGRTPDCATVADHPVTCVTRAQAAAFCAFAGKRLVRSLEHVAAAAGTTGRTYPWGNGPPTADRLNACGKECDGKSLYSAFDAWVTTAPVGSVPNGQTPEGVVDLAGNAAEWVDATPSIVRGGSYADGDPNAVASSAAVATPAETSAPTIGFRCARDQ